MSGPITHPQMPRLEDLKGTDIVLYLRHHIVEQKHPVLVTKLIEIEQSGIWIEGKDLADYFYAKFSLSLVPKMPVIFVPFAQIAWIYSSANYPSILGKGSWPLVTFAGMPRVKHRSIG